ncbi:MAG: HEPN domain-containing protein [Synergistaceae bacterium]|nr:HEPN domain-containing protein [Synergistaceae bacterium]
MNDIEKYEYWLAHAQDDLQTAKAMFHAKRWMYVMFCCQQAVEKLIKGLYGLHLGFDNIPRIHNISRLISYFTEKLSQPVTQEKFDFFDILTQYYLNNRYPDYIEDLLTQTKEDSAKDILTKTAEVFAWLQTLKP